MKTGDKTMDKSTKKHFIVKNAGNKSGIIDGREIELVALGGYWRQSSSPALNGVLENVSKPDLRQKKYGEAIAMSLKVKNVPINKINETAERLLKGE
ncbi:MAG: hypothetical protein U5N26_00005, partial [Candidatus Marinimicrobia bacterium]|nr:hypothetical protein [Candidatus Neomarinimicrobiota bacterium]